jgi:RNA-directed DNA polymerase
MNASHSTPPKGEKLAKTQLENQWINFDWKKAEIFVNRLQSRIAKAVNQCKWSLVKRLQYLNSVIKFASRIL